MLQSLLQLIAPDECLQCGAEGALWCDWCRLDQDYLPSRCFRCHALTPNFTLCSKCYKATGLRQIYVCFEYKGVVKALIHALKFQSKRQAAEVIAKILDDALPILPTNTIVTNVPTARRRVRQRGFDHTQAMAKLFAKQRSLPFQSMLLRHGSSRQVGASQAQRRAQTSGLYSCKPNVDLEGKDILLIDDVITTGATMSEAAKVLKQAGAKSVACAVLVYTK